MVALSSEASVLDAGARRPASATALLTGFTGLLGAILAIALLRDSDLPLHHKALAVVATTAAAMIAVELAYFRTYRNRSTLLSAETVRALDNARVARKLLGFWVTIGAVGAAYWIFPEYRKPFYDPYWAAVGACLPWVAIASPFYIAYIDRRQLHPEDVYADIGAFVVLGRIPADLAQARRHALGWIVKGYFLPLMFVYFCSELDILWRALGSSHLFGFLEWHDRARNMLFLTDVLFASVGYIFTLRILDSHIRTVEPTVLGWLVCVACYAPFSNITHGYFDYQASGHQWDVVLAAWPWLRVVWGTAILACLVVYSWSTMCFGLRFSNLTHRGIITSGPYRWVRHPAYLSKNITWWLISMPFLTSAGLDDAVRHSAMLLLLNGLYALRAITEERHLLWDPDYVAYKEFIRREGLWARCAAFARTLPGRRGGAVAAAERAGYGPDRRFVHIDGALNAVVLPFADHVPPAIRPSFQLPIDSLSTSGHKMIGTPMPCGVLLARRWHVDRVAAALGDLRSNDTTLLGSRNGHAVLAIWNRLTKHGLIDCFLGEYGRWWRAARAQNQCPSPNSGMPESKLAPSAEAAAQELEMIKGREACLSDGEGRRRVSIGPPPLPARRPA